MILLIDNFDSFAHNLARYFRRLELDVLVVRNDQIDVTGVRRLDPQAILLSPGPRAPDDAGCCLDVVRGLWRDYPLLGICLGHQAIVTAFGGRVIRCAAPMHGRTSEVTHDGQGVFEAIPTPFSACRYHSLVVDPETIPGDLTVSAVSRDRIVMAVRHRSRPIVGLQFHPESILTQHGYAILANYLRLAGLAVPEQIPSLDDEFVQVPPPRASWPDSPATF